MPLLGTLRAAPRGLASKFPRVLSFPITPQLTGPGRFGREGSKREQITQPVATKAGLIREASKIYQFMKRPDWA